ncbi:MAG: hypothetical protein KDA25_06475 [Phycisphaerales bacterium]|nr:hypothetical protein [Phycisphaerales bacterium]
MRRWVLVILRCLLAGMATNVALAWALVLTIRYEGRMGGPTVKVVSVVMPDAADPDHVWGVLQSRRFGSMGHSARSSAGPPDVMAQLRPDLVPSWSRLNNPPRSVTPTERLYEDARGWPMLALHCGFRSVVGRPGHQLLDGIRVRAHPDGSTVRSIALPLRPIWSGFAVNTVVHAAAIGVLVLLGSRVRRVMRRRVGLCVHCAYDLRGLAAGACPECGATARPPADPPPQAREAGCYGQIQDSILNLARNRHRLCS